MSPGVVEKVTVIVGGSRGVIRLAPFRAGAGRTSDVAKPGRGTEAATW